MADIRKKIFGLMGVSILVLSLFMYLLYYLFGSVNSSIKIHTGKREELMTLEEKQKQAQRLEREILEVSKDAQKLKSFLLGTDFNDTIAFTIQIENLSRELGMTHNIVSTKQAANLSPSIRGDLPKDAMINTFPHVVFGIDLEGSYASLVRFIERLNTLPYYLYMERLDIRTGKVSEEGLVTIKAFVQLKVFTHEDKDKE